MKLINNKKEIINLKGKVFDEFEKEEGIKEIVLLGKNGGIKKIIIE